MGLSSTRSPSQQRFALAHANVELGREYVADSSLDRFVVALERSAAEQTTYCRRLERVWRVGFGGMLALLAVLLRSAALSQDTRRPSDLSPRGGGGGGEPRGLCAARHAASVFITCTGSWAARWGAEQVVRGAIWAHFPSLLVTRRAAHACA